MLAIGPAIFGAVALFALRASTVKLAEIPDYTKTVDSLVESALAPAEGETRPEYRYSVIPGGVYTSEEFEAAIQEDPVVADEYGYIDTSAVRAEVLSEPRLAYVSYRLNDRIYWTKNKVALKAGETILSDGVTELRR